MADQTNRTPAPSRDGSPESVALELWTHLRGPTPRDQPWLERRAELLDIYAECLHATRGLRNPKTKYGEDAG